MSSGLYQIRDKDLDTTLDLTRLKPYGDTMNDGKVQLSFTLPVKDDDKGAAAAVLVAQKMGLADPNVALRQKLDETFTFYVVYGSLTHTINYNEIVVQTVADEAMGMDETDEFLKERLGRKLVVVGASTGTDAHTVGIDAIMNRKGFAGHYGLERYEMIEAYNLGSQVPNEEFLRKADLIRWGMLKSKMDEAVRELQAFRDASPDSPKGIDYSTLGTYCWYRHGTDAYGVPTIEMYGIHPGENLATDTTPPPTGTGWVPYTSSSGNVSRYFVSSAEAGDDPKSAAFYAGDKKEIDKASAAGGFYVNDPDTKQWWPIFQISITNGQGYLKNDYGY